MQGLLTIVSLIVIFGLLVFVHELGHFLAAKMIRVPVLDFALGFGKTLWQRQVRGTTYKINLIPLGGYVLLEGEEDRTGIFHNKPLWAKLVVFVAGIVMNILLAILLFAVYLSSTGYRTEIVNIVDHEFAGTVSQQSLLPLSITGLTTGAAADMAGLQVGDSLVAIDSHYFQTIDEFRALLAENAGRSIIVSTYDLDSRAFSEYSVDLPNQEVDHLGVQLSISQFPYYYIEYPANIGSAAIHTLNVVRYQVPAIGELIARSVRESDASYATTSVNGIIGVSSVVGDLVVAGALLELVNLAALVSISLAVVNLLPLPLLDGGQVLISVLEAIRRKRFSEGVIQSINLLSFIFLILISIVVAVKDIWQYGIWTQFVDTVSRVLGF